MSRYPAAIMATCVVPWTEGDRFDEKRFRKQVRHLAGELTPHLYIFGTAGEGYAVTGDQFETISRTFLEEAAACGAEAILGIIHLSLPEIQRRIEKAASWGARRIQLSLPSWGALTEQEVEVFFRETCGRFPEMEFMHYNLMRAKHLVSPAEYARLADAHPNLVATKNTNPDPAFLTELCTRAPQLTHFLGEAGYAQMREYFECGLLISIASTNPERAKKFFAARGKDLRRYQEELTQALAALKEATGPGPFIDGAYDKLIYQLSDPEFPLRLLPPYLYPDEATSLARYREALSRLAPEWLPSAEPAPSLTA